MFTYIVLLLMAASEEHCNAEVTDNLTDECNWKRKLSAAFNDEQIFFSLVLLSIFYVGYTAAKADFDADNTSIDNKERFIQSCYCSTHQRSFFRAWFYLFCLIWFIIHTYTFLAQLFVKSCPWCGIIITGLLTIGNICLEFICFESCMKVRSCVCNIDTPGNDQNQLKIPEHPKADLESNISLLWYQYCKLYVVGYAEDDDMINFNTKNQPAKKTECCPCSCSISKCENQQEDESDDCVCCSRHCTCPTLHIKYCNQDGYFHIAHALKGITRAFLFLIKYMSQLVTVPLLLLQIFDTYSLLCFSPDLYCSRTSEYKLHLAQAAITLLFFCSLALSQLASMMLTWNPWPQKKKKQTYTEKSTQTEDETIF